jgi:hypothetical protein
MDTTPTNVTAERFGTRTQNTIALATEFVVVSWVQPSSSDGRIGWYDYEAYSTEQEARKAHEDYERGEYDRHRAVCIFASRHGVPVGRVA